MKRTINVGCHYGPPEKRLGVWMGRWLPSLYQTTGSQGSAMFLCRDFSTAFFNSIPLSGSLAGSMLSSQSNQQLMVLDSTATNSLSTSKPSLEPVAASLKPAGDAVNKDRSVCGRKWLSLKGSFRQPLWAPKGQTGKRFLILPQSLTSKCPPCSQFSWSPIL